MKKKYRGIYAVRAQDFENVYGADERRIIGELIDINETNVPGSVLQEAPEKYGDIEIIMGGWGLPKLTSDLLTKLPNLKAIFYSAGSIKYFVTPEFWVKDIPVCSAYSANAVPVAEFTLAQIILALKNAIPKAVALRQAHQSVSTGKPPGCFGSTVGLISLGMVGKLVRKYLRLLEVNVIAYDPFVSKEMAAELGVTMVSLDEIFQLSDVVSLHTPWLKETEKMIQRRHFEFMKPGSTFINTARGAVVDEREMIEILKKRTDVFAMLDVSHPEPPAPNDPIYTLPNILYTPHIAGSLGTECRRMGRLMISELERFIEGRPLECRISQEKAELLG